ncbi:MAG: response regulator transcription factor [Candidatus Nealsonbacteria bacterium]|nr:response regulator transcription factor [Candidatus Nealsonbacteria bacterium]
MAKKILLVEDEKILGEMYQDKLTQAGFEVSLVFEVSDGLEIAQKEKPDLILLDMLLPREDGISFLTKLRKIPEISDTTVVVFSNYDDPDTKKAALGLDAKEYLIKTNYTPQEIIEKIKSYLNQ